MKRFFCSVCKRVKRTQRWPVIVENPQSIYATDRIGECDYHSNPSLRLVHSVKVKSVKSPKVTEVKSSGKSRKVAK